MSFKKVFFSNLKADNPKQEELLLVYRKVEIKLGKMYNVCNFCGVIGCELKYCDLYGELLNFAYGEGTLDEFDKMLEKLGIYREEVI